MHEITECPYIVLMFIIHIYYTQVRFVGDWYKYLATPSS